MWCISWGKTVLSIRDAEGEWRIRLMSLFAGHVGCHVRILGKRTRIICLHSCIPTLRFFVIQHWGWMSAHTLSSALSVCGKSQLATWHFHPFCILYKEKDCGNDFIHDGIIYFLMIINFICLVRRDGGLGWTLRDFALNFFIFNPTVRVQCIFLKCCQ